jgi:hypothetical protein
MSPHGPRIYLFSSASRQPQVCPGYDGVTERFDWKQMPGEFLKKTDFSQQTAAERAAATAHHCDLPELFKPLTIGRAVVWVFDVRVQGTRVRKPTEVGVDTEWKCGECGKEWIVVRGFTKDSRVWKVRDKDSSLFRAMRRWNGEEGDPHTPPPPIQPGWHMVGDNPHEQAYWDGVAWTKQMEWDGSTWVETPLRPAT